MTRKLLMAVFALLFFALSNLHLGFRVSIDDIVDEGHYSLMEQYLGLRAAIGCAGELSDGAASLPDISLRPCLSLQPPEGQAKELSAALLERTEGVEVLDAVLINGMPVGKTRDGNELMAQLRGFLADNMPIGAAYGSFGGEIKLRRVYAPEGSADEASWLLPLIDALIPAVYLDADGNYVKT